MDIKVLNLNKDIEVYTTNIHKFGTDAFLLSHFSNCKKKDLVFDIGTGCGIIPFILHKKFNCKKIVGIDIQKEAINLFNMGIEKNNLSYKISSKLCDVKDVFNSFLSNSFSVVVSNPPYKKIGTGIVNSDKKVLTTRHEYKCDIDDICKAAKFLLNDKGKLFICQRPERLLDVIISMRNNGIEPKYVRFVKKNVFSEPWLFLICGVKNGGEFFKVLKDLIVYDENGDYTEEMKQVYGAYYE